MTAEPEFVTCWHCDDEYDPAAEGGETRGGESLCGRCHEHYLNRIGR